MKGSNSHITVTAYHEAGHALAALKQGRFVKTVEVSLINPGNGRTIIWLARKNPYDLVRHPDLAWRHTYNNTLEEIFVLLAGPIAEARCLGKPIRSLGSASDYIKCISRCARLETLADYVSPYLTIDPVDTELLLNQARDKVKRWVARPRNWHSIEVLALHLSKFPKMDDEGLNYALGVALGNGMQMQLGGTSAANKIRARKIMPRATRRSNRFSTPINLQKYRRTLQAIGTQE